MSEYVSGTVPGTALKSGERNYGIDLLRIVPVDHVGGVPVGILLHETAYCGVIVSGSQIIQTRLGVVILPAVAEWVFVAGAGVLLVAEGIVAVGYIWVIY